MLARHAILLTPSIAASLPLACRGAERTFLAPHACTRPKNPLSSLFATHPRPPWEASPFLFALSAAERNTSLAIALPQSPIPYPPSSHTLTHSLAQRPSHNSFPINRLHTLSIATGGCTSLCGYSVFKGRDHNILQTGVWPHTIP